jgi:hypothetical protein
VRFTRVLVAFALLTASVTAGAAVGLPAATAVGNVPVTMPGLLVSVHYATGARLPQTA